MSLPLATERFSAWLSASVRPALASRGFRKTGSTFYRRGADGWGLVNFQVSQFGTRSDVRFYVNVGVALDRLLELDGADPALHPPEHRCHWRSRVEHLSDRPTATFWDVNDQTDLDALTEAIAPVLDDAARFIEERITVVGFLEALSRALPSAVIRPPASTIRGALAGAIA